MPRNTLKVLHPVINLTVSIPYSVLVSSTNLSYLKRQGKLSDCLIEINTCFAQDDPYNKIDIVFNDKDLFNMKKNQKNKQKESENETDDLQLDSSTLSKLIQTISTYLNKQIVSLKELPILLKSQMLYKMNILPYKPLGEVAYMSTIRDLREGHKRGRNVEKLESIPIELLKSLQTRLASQDPLLVAEIAPFLTSRELNFILKYHTGEIKREWFDTEKLYFKNLLLNEYQRSDTSELEDNFELKSEGNQHLEEKEIENLAIDENTIIEREDVFISDQQRFLMNNLPVNLASNNSFLSNIKNRIQKVLFTSPSALEMKKGWRNAFFTQERVNKVIKDRIERFVTSQENNPRGFEKKIKKKSSDKNENIKHELHLTDSLSNSIERSKHKEFLVKVLNVCNGVYANVLDGVIEEIPLPDQFENHSDENLKNLNKTQNKLEAPQITKDIFKLIKSLNLPAINEKVKFHSIFGHEKSTIKYEDVVEYDGNVYAFVFDKGIVPGNAYGSVNEQIELSFERQKTSASSQNKDKLETPQEKGKQSENGLFSPISDKLLYCIFFHEDTFFVSNRIEKSFRKIHSKLQIVKNKEELLLKTKDKRKKNEKIKFDIFKGDPEIIYGDGYVKLIGKFKIIVEINENSWQSMEIN